MSGLRHVIRAALATPWAIQPEKLQAIAEVLARHAQGGRLSAEEIHARIGGGKADPMQGAGVAVLPLYGIIGHRMGQVQDISGPGGTSTEQFGAWFEAALKDPAIGAIVLDVDSPGGGVSGVQELADKIFRARGEKPIVAIANSLAASAAYWIAAAADELWITPSGDVGSIGVYAMHQDLSAAFADEGITNTLISAGKYKIEGNPYEPLSDEARAAMQERVDEFYTAFTKAVAIYRGTTLKDVQSGFGEGRIVSAKKAVQLGMADKVGAMDTLLARLGAGGPRSRLKADTMAPLLHAAAELLAPLSPSLTLPAAGEIAAALVFTDAAVVAAVPVVHPPHAADEAKEHVMPPSTAAADAADELTAGVIAAEAQRIDDLLALASEYSRSHADVKRWKVSKASLAEAQAEVLADLKKDHQAKPALSVSVRPLDGGENGTKAGPFRHIGEQMAAVMEAARPGGRTDPRLFQVMEQAAATGGGTTVGTDGGFLVQRDFAADLLKESMDEGQLASRCSVQEISANADRLTVAYIAETSRATGSRFGGVQVYRRAEADTVTAKKPRIEEYELRLEDLMGLAYVTGRLDQDAQAMGGVFTEAFRREFAFTLDDEIVRGTGVGQCLGILNAPCTIGVAKETGQLAATIVAENILKMWPRVSARSQARGAWFINTECTPQLQSMMLGTGVSGQLVYSPPGGLSAAPYGNIYGRPVIPIEQASALGTVGDLMFLDLSEYLLISKGGLDEQESVHVRFLYDEKVIRWITRVNGAPKCKTALTPYKGSNTTCPFVTLNSRA